MYTFYTSDGLTWSEWQKLVASDGAVDDNFGSSVVVSSSVLAVGAIYGGDMGIDTGKTRSDEEL